MDSDLKSIWEQTISSYFTTSVKIPGITPISGGSINQAAKATTSIRDFFIKWNSKQKYLEMFEKERAGLELLALHSPLLIPEIIASGETENQSFIILKYIAQGKPSSDFWKNFGVGLASLHRKSAPTFGLEYDNYIGSLPQSNKSHLVWVDFFINERLQPQIILAKNNQLVDNHFINRIQQTYKLLPSIFPEEKPALLHGDLWSGNFLCDVKNVPVLIDPAVYYGHREAELAFTKLFGGFEDSFYTTYNEAFPLEKGFEKRFDIYNLYPLLVHLNLFGIQYLNPIKKILDRLL